MDLKVGYVLAARLRIGVPSDDSEPSARADDSAALASEKASILAMDAVAGMQLGGVEKLIEKEAAHDTARQKTVMLRYPLYIYSM